MRSRSGTFVRLIRSQWHWAAVGCIAAGSTGLLLVPGVAQLPGIVPDADFSPTSAKSAVSLGAAGLGDLSAITNVNAGLKPQAAQGKISIELSGVPVSEAIAMISGQSEIGIVIGTDVDADAKVPFIKAIDVTPEEAIRRVSLAAGLRWAKMDAQTYFVGKTIPEGVGTSAKATPALPPRTNPIWNISNNFSETDVLPTLGGNASPTNNSNPYGIFDISPMASRNNSQRGEQEIRPIRVRNVPPRTMAWWLDPKHQAEPFEYQHARASMLNNLSPYRLQPGVDPAYTAIMNGQGGSFVSPYTSGTYTNPYSNPYTSAAGNPYSPWTRASAQLGGFGNQNNGGNNNNNRFGNNGNGNGNGGFGGNGVLELPEGVDQLVAIDAQNVLLVYGTTEGIQRLQTIIEYLDRPIRQVEIEAQFIDVSVNEARGFGIQFFNADRLNNNNNNTDNGTDNGTDNNNSNSNSSLGIGAGVPGANVLKLTYKQAQAQINFLNSGGRARIINSPRVTTMNNLSANLQSQQITPIVLTSNTQGIGGQVGQQQNAFFLTTSIGIQVTPTINNDDTITVFMTPFVQTQVPTPSLQIGSNSSDDDDDDNNNNNNNNSGSSTIPTVLAQSLTTVANVKDNDVIVLGGLRTRTESIVRSRIPILSRLPLIGKLFRSNNKTDVDRELVIFLTARILRRTNDTVPIAGP